MKTSILITLLFFSLNPASFAQTARSPQPVLSGSVMSISPQPGYRDELPFVVYKVDLLLQLRNDGARPLILFRPEGCQIKIEFLRSATFGEDAFADLTTEPWVDPYRSRYDGPPRDTLLEFANELEAATDPSKEGLLIIGPGKLVEFPISIMLNSGYSLEISSGQTYKDVLRNSPKSEFQALRVVFNKSFKRVRPDTAFLKSLQTKWRPFGFLVVDGNGEFTVRSETIINKTS